MLFYQHLYSEACCHFYLYESFVSTKDRIILFFLGWLGEVYSVQFSSVTQLCTSLCDSMDCSTPGLPVYHQLPEFTQTHIHWVGDAIQPSHPLLLPPSIFPSIRIFPNESVLRIRWPKDWSFSFSISPSNECSGLTSFRMDWLDLLAVQGTLKSLRHSSKASTDHQNTHNFEILNKYIFITCEKARYTLYKLNHTNMYAQLCVWTYTRTHRSDQIRSVAQSCLTLCHPMNRSTPGLPVHHQLRIHQTPYIYRRVCVLCFLYVSVFL